MGRHSHFVARHRTLALALLVAAALATAPALATTYVPVSDQALIDRATVIGTFEVVSRQIAPTSLITTEYQMRVQSLIKGELSSSTLLVRVLGGEVRSGASLRISGLPSFHPGERDVLLFLAPRHDGTWGIVHVLMGAFRSLERAEGDLLVRPQMSDATSVARDGGAAPNESTLARDRARFLDWIADRVAGRRHGADYFVPIDPVALAPRFTQFRDPDTGLAMRWFDFDTGGSVPWHSADQGPVGYVDKGVAAVQNGLAAWTNLTQTPIKLIYAGQRPIDGGFDGFDGVNTVLFEDPHQEIDEAFDCSQGGVLAIGGPFYDADQVFHFKGLSWHPVLEAAVVTNAGISCFLRNNTTRLSEILGHELGHTLGLGHSCGDEHSPSCASSAELDDALMRATVHDDARGASLRTDDMAGGRAIYSPPNGGGGAPKAPTQLTAQLATDDVTLHWNDRSNNEQGFRVYRKLGAGAFEVIGQTAAGVTSFSDMDLGNGSWSYQVRAFNPSGDSAASNTVSVVVEVGDPGVAQLAATAFYGSEASGQAVVTLNRVGGKSGPLSVRLRTRDLSATAPLDYAAHDVVVTWDSQDDQPKVVTLTIVDDFTAEDTELLEVLLETVPPTGLTPALLGTAAVAIADNDGSPGCASADRHLCLLGGRFKVEVEWRNQRNGQRGFGHALVGTDQSGYFWFFQPENVELIVKSLDGRPITGAHWLFYGALSDVEYWITVTDTATGVVKLYHNTPGNICGVGDTGAFPESDAAAVTTGGVVAPLDPTPAWLAPLPRLSSRAACVADGQTLCLLAGRFEVKVNWRNQRTGATGLGTAIPFSDQSGFFWFFNADNIELVAKALDGQMNNGMFWFFYGALSDVEYTIRVTDTATTHVHSYNNAAGNICGVGDINAFPGD